MRTTYDKHEHILDQEFENVRLWQVGDDYIILLKLVVDEHLSRGNGRDKVTVSELSLMGDRV